MDPTTAYDDRPISMYDNLNMTNNVNTTSTPKTKLNEPVTMSPSSTSTSTSKTNGAAHSSPFTDITFKFNDNNNTNGTPLLNGRNRNLNEMPPNAMTALYSTPYKMANTPSITKPAIITTTTASPPPQYSPSLAASEASIGNTFTTSLSPSAAAATATTTSSSPAPAQLLAPPIAALAEATTANNSTINASRLNERPLSQHSQFELNETIHSIAAVKAALNEAKSKFFGINGYGPQHQPFVDPHESQRQNLLSSSAATQPVVVQQKPQPKYQNIPENSALFRTPTANVAPELPPKPIEYQNLNKTPTPPNKNPSSSINNNSPVDPHHQLSRKMPDGTIYNQISLNDLDGGRSQTVYMATTVPQNIKGNKIAGRHTPTRSSLRHSRMLVVSNKHYEVEIKHPNPMGFHQPNLARWLLILQIIIGILLISLSIWIFVLSPNTPIQDNPYWCGLVLLITGIIGLILIRYHRIKRDKTREHCFIFLRMDSYVLALLSLLLCCVALIFAAIHYGRITASDTKCESVHMLIEHGSCVCTFHAPPLTNNATEISLSSSMSGEETTNATDQEMVDNSYKFEYRDLSCDEVTGPWTTILGLSFIINSVGFVISFVYMILLACCRSASKRSYTTVRTSTF